MWVRLHYPGSGIGDYIVLAVVLVFAVYVVAVSLWERRRQHP